MKHDDHFCKEVAPMSLMYKASFQGVCAGEHDGDHEAMTISQVTFAFEPDSSTSTFLANSVIIPMSLKLVEQFGQKESCQSHRWTQWLC